MIVGTGPVGLTLALILARHNVNFVIIDKDKIWSDKSKAMTITARTLELLHTVEVGSTLVEAGISANFINYYYSNIFLGKADLRLLQSPYNLILQIPQSRTTALLDRTLKDTGAPVLRCHELTGFQRFENGVISEILDHSAFYVMPIEAKGSDYFYRIITTIRHFMH